MVNKAEANDMSEPAEITQKHEPSYRLIASNAPEIGMDTAISYVSNGYLGHCAVVAAANNCSVIAVLPNEIEANSVARYAITPDGGYGSVYVEPTEKKITHSGFSDWAFGD